MSSPFVINIGRSLGSGGRAIGHILAKEFNIAYYDREILALAAKESGFCPEVFERNDEKNRFLRTLGNIIPFIGGGSTYYNNELSNENLFRIQSEAIRKAAEDHSCIFIGRCADYVLRNHPRCVNVFVTTVRQRKHKALSKKEIVNVPSFTTSIAQAHGVQPAPIICVSTRQCSALRERLLLLKNS